MKHEPGQLDEKCSESIHNHRGEFSHVVERFKDRLTSDNLRLAERYLNCELELVVHFLVHIGGNIHDVLATYQRELLVAILAKPDRTVESDINPIRR